MPWPSWTTFWRRSQRDDDTEIKKTSNTSSEAPSIPQSIKHAASWDSNLNRTDWSHYTTTQTIVISLVTTATTLALIRGYKTYIRRIPTVDYLKPGFFRKRNFYGYVTRVGDGDNFHLFHTPGGRMMGWGWMPKRRVKDMMRIAKREKQTMHVRIAGVDAPEAAHFGKTAQPYSKEALEWLRGFILNKYVRVYPYREDQYKRVVCSAYKRRFLFFNSDIGLNMIKRGLATVYEAKFGSEFGNKEEQYKAAEARAKQKKIGMWQEPGIFEKMLGRDSHVETPREYKTRTAQEEKKDKKSKSTK